MTVSEVLAAAIRDFAAHGFDSEQRLNDWLARLRDAIAASVRPAPAMEQAMRDALSTIFHRLVDKRQVLKVHPGVDRFTLDRIAPRLRLELERRMLASSQLIKLNRAEMIEKTLRRFSGWATSVPAGGSETVDKRDVKDDVYKPLASLPFVERRLLTDQGHKLNASISAVLAKDSNAIAAQWYSRWRVANYNYREDHKDRDGLTYLVRDTWATKAGLVKVGAAGWSDGITQPGEEVYCFPESTMIPFADCVEIAYRRWFSGDLTEIVTSSGKTLRATANHPVLTSKGWIAINSLNEGDDVIEIADEVVGSNLFGRLESCQDDTVPLISEIFGSLEKLGSVETTRGRSEQFHGDGAEGDVDIVYATRFLSFGRQALLNQCRKQLKLTASNHGSSSQGSLNLFFDCCRAATFSVMGGLDKIGSSFLRFFSHSIIGCFTCASGFTPNFDYSLFDNAAAYSKFLRKSQDAFAGFVPEAELLPVRLDSSSRLEFGAQDAPCSIIESHDWDTQRISDFLKALPFRTKLTNVIKVDRAAFSGHVYNLQTNRGWYISNNILTKNCRCHWNYLYHLRQLPDDMTTQKGKDAMAEARVA